jgi:hypothetical protein
MQCSCCSVIGHKRTLSYGVPNVPSLYMIGLLLSSAA